jgi:hypothetical protein
VDLYIHSPTRFHGVVPYTLLSLNFYGGNEETPRKPSRISNLAPHIYGKLEGSGRGLTEVLPGSLPGGTKENDQKPQSG